jgi:hypothetical protein
MIFTIQKEDIYLKILNMKIKFENIKANHYLCEYK